MLLNRKANSTHNHNRLLDFWQAVEYTTTMAYVEHTNGNKRSVSREVGEKLWKSLRNPGGLDDKQLAYLASIKALWLDWHRAPDDYIQENLGWIIPVALNDWAVDRKGKAVRPATESAWLFAKRWGLWEFGGPTGLVTGGQPALFAETPATRSLPVNDR